MFHIKRFENFSNFISSDELLKHISYYTFYDLVRSSIPEEVTNVDMNFCDSQMHDLLINYNISFKSIIVKRLKDDNVYSCINYTINKNWWVTFYKLQDEYWLIETYFGYLNWSLPGGSDYQYWLSDSYDGIKEWILKMGDIFLKNIIFK